MQGPCSNMKWYATNKKYETYLCESSYVSSEGWVGRRLSHRPRRAVGYARHADFSVWRLFQVAEVSKGQQVQSRDQQWSVGAHPNSRKRPTW